MVSVKTEVPDPGVTLAGVNAHGVEGGSPEHVRVTALSTLEPSPEVIDTV